jgi:hypothetical protein
MSQCQKCKAIVNQKWTECLVCGCPVDGCELSPIESIPMPKSADPETEYARAQRQAIIDEDGGPSEPQNRHITRQVDSKVLGRTVDMVLDRDKPNDVIFDGVPYTMAEMRRLKGLGRESLIVAHDVKREFKGEVMP